MSNVVAVFGLSGVGKSWLIARFAAVNPVLHLQASQLLKDAKAAVTGMAMTSEELRKDAVIDNQALLISAFVNARNAAPVPILFDGHCVIDAGDKLVEIPASVVEALGPSALLFVHAEPSAIFNRRTGDMTRVRPTRSIVELKEHQDRARAICGEYADLLKINLHIIEADDEASFAAAASAVLWF